MNCLTVLCVHWYAHPEGCAFVDAFAIGSNGASVKSDYFPNNCQTKTKPRFFGFG